MANQATSYTSPTGAATPLTYDASGSRTAGPAPAGLESTGDPSHNAPWTALGVPAISVPLPVERGPLGVQMAAAWGRDDALVAVAAELETLVA